MTWWERDGRSKNLQWTYQERKKNLVMQKMPILTTSSLRSLKKKSGRTAVYVVIF
jgi:hypothetical protein